jgi:hypothetical protein
MLALFFILCISTVHSYREIMKYNIQYCISIPHYLSLTGPKHVEKKNKLDTSYKIPEYINKKIFIQNIPYKKRNKQ